MTADELDVWCDEFASQLTARDLQVILDFSDLQLLATYENFIEHCGLAIIRFKLVNADMPKYRHPPFMLLYTALADELNRRAIPLPLHSLPNATPDTPTE